MFYQMTALDDEWREAQAFGELPGEDIMVEFPVYGSFNDEGPCRTIYCSFVEVMTDEAEVTGRRGFTVGFDVTRPGYITLHEGIVALPEKLDRDERLADCEPIEPPEEGLYMASEGGSVGYRFTSYVMPQSVAETVCELLSQASLSEVDKQDERFNAGLDHMDPAVREAVYRHYVLRKRLNKAPEEAFKPSEWYWGYLPSQFDIEPSNGLVADHYDRLEAYAPPGIRPCDGLAINKFLQELDPAINNQWIKAIWDKEQLPDDFNALFTEPTGFEVLSPAELIQAVPEEMKVQIALWAHESLFWHRNWVDHKISDINSVVALEEPEFNERKRRSENKEESFYWGLMPSFTVCLRYALGLAGEVDSYPAWIARYDEMAGAYKTFYDDYVEVLRDCPEDEEEPLLPYIWKSTEERQGFYKAAWKVFQKLAALPSETEA
jgi:hypothetical protein